MCVMLQYELLVDLLLQVAEPQVGLGLLLVLHLILIGL